MLKKSLIQKILAFLARAAIKKYRPTIVGITGSVGKTSTREAVFAVLKKKYRVRTAEKNYNNEIGLPLTVLGIPHYGRNIFGWFSALLRVLIEIYLSKHEGYPEVLILEYGVSHPGDMDYLLSIAKPRIAVVTAIGDIPVHVEFFKDPAELIMEKAKLVEALSSDGYAVLNHDDFAVYEMREKVGARVVTYGTEKHADLKISNFQFSIFKDKSIGDVPDGISFKLEYKGNSVPFRINNAFGLPHAYSAAAAAAIGLIMDFSLVEISEALRNYIPPAGRLRLLKGIKNSFVIDDTYNAAPEAMRLALDTLKALPGKRKIAILGDMLEIGKYAEQAHRAVGDQAAGFVDLLFCVGPTAKFIADEYKLHRHHPFSTVSSEQNKKSFRSFGAIEFMPQDNVFHFDDPISAGRALKPLIRPGDLILVKGSQGVRMEKTVREIIAEPEKAEELLVRQEEVWRNTYDRKLDGIS